MHDVHSDYHVQSEHCHQTLWQWANSRPTGNWASGNPAFTTPWPKSRVAATRGKIDRKWRHVWLYAPLRVPTLCTLMAIRDCWRQLVMTLSSDNFAENDVWFLRTIFGQLIVLLVFLWRILPKSALFGQVCFAGQHLLLPLMTSTLYLGP